MHLILTNRPILALSAAAATPPALFSRADSRRRSRYGSLDHPRKNAADAAPRTWRSLITADTTFSITQEFKKGVLQKQKQKQTNDKLRSAVYSADRAESLSL